MLFSTVFLSALYVSRLDSVPVEVQLEKSMLPVFGRPFEDPIPCAVTGTRGRRNTLALFSCQAATA
jgi:hypothetical protein